MADQESTARHPFLLAPVRPRAVIRDWAERTRFPSMATLVAGASVASAMLIQAGKSAGNSPDLPSLLVLVPAFAVLSAAFVFASVAIAGPVARSLGGRASNRSLRAALLWGIAPSAWAGLFALVLLALASVTGATLAALLIPLVIVGSLWSMVITFLMMSEVEGFGFARTLTAYLGIFVVMACLALPIRILLWQPFDIPSTSMAPTLNVGDAFFVSKYAYGYSRHSLPLSPPVFAGRIFGAEPQRGDVVVFKLPSDGRTDYVKRVIGLPGDTIEIRSGSVVINGETVPRRRLDEDFVLDDAGRSTTLAQVEETLPSGATCRVLDAEPNGPLDNAGPYKVPAGHFFVMGDNRDNSQDSRSFGPVPNENLVGRATVIYLSPSHPNRMLTTVK